ncbi:FAD-dependent sensor of blue light [Pontibacter ummariensis]|uniref:Sensors of blue-light using FAD n=1 Tax=Pontibacter ummariensis TaxID=1610492 RepID=A0A239BQR7_9BACT|nr:BLUF domain-containing protein [Pontibacter ummariensis]PRY15677.1 FAD-dependent sensor of blue light [Pontibacter ummariensis]SNS10186.1 Sensors of blue-light using FAD [Pontibacter ummariensis]
MHQLVYVSSAVELVNEDVLKALLVKSRANNEAIHLTGMLLYHDGNFIQVLEGEKEQVLKLFHKIEKDARHRGIIKLISVSIQSRDFPDWSMGFKSLSAQDYKQVMGYFDPTVNKQLKVPGASDDRVALSLLKTFTANNIY